MSKERKFHEFIEQQNREDKDAVWVKIQQREMQEKEPAPALPKARSFFGRKWVTITASSLAVVVIGAFSTWGFLSLNDGKNNDNKGRYFTSQSYEKVITQRTLKEYAQGIEKDLLYFDWYQETDFLEDYAWQLRDTQEIICFQEEIIDINTGCMVYLFVIEADTEVEDFSLDKETDRKSEIGGIEIDWHYSMFKSNANFVYEDYRYYLRIDEPIDENHILDLVEELLP